MTDSVPKCLVPLGGKPLLHYWLLLFRKHGIEEMLINLHHLPEQVNGFLNGYEHSISIKTFYEEKLLGSAGTVRVNESWVCQEDCFLIAYADNLTNADLGQMIAFHRKEKPVMTAGLFKTNRPRECGIVLMNGENVITDFAEKPESPKSDLACAGIFIAGPEVFRRFGDECPLDFGFHVLPKLVGEMKGFVIKEFLIDIGDIKRYNQAQAAVKHLTF